MNSRKSLKDISWNVTEEEYRKDPALSYSTLARYEREGFNNLDKLFERIETPSLTFGSAVDSIITGGQEEFDERFIVAEFPATPDSVIKIVKSLFNQFGKTGIYRALDDIPDSIVISETVVQNYQLNWRPETRAKVIKEKGAEYYNLMSVAEDKTIIDTNTYSDVQKAVAALQESDATKFYFAPNNPFDNSIERCYQLKFKATLDGIDYRCMADCLLVSYDDKIIVPIDLKTSSHTEWDFHKSFVEWQYQLQARLYWRIIRDNLDRDEYFKDFALSEYTFVVVNKKTLTPLAWNCPFTRAIGTLTFGKNNQIEMRDPFEIGKELSYYLATRPNTPVGISTTGKNDLRYWISKL